MLPNEKIIQTKTCARCGTPFDVTDRDLAFYDKISPVFASKKYQIPTPKLCPECRTQRRHAFYNPRSLYKRQDAQGEEVISVFSPDKPYTVYTNDVWWSDAWNPLDYGKEFDFSRPFFEQFYKLKLKVPVRNVMQ